MNRPVQQHLSHAAPTLNVGYHTLVSDVSLNFQLNRWLGYSGSLLPVMQRMAPRLTDYGRWIEAFLELAELARAEGRQLDAAYHTRSAEFFMKPDDPRRGPCRERFLTGIREGFAITPREMLAVPYAGAYLPGYRFTPSTPARDVIVLFAGFDSYIEELVPILLMLRDAGYDVVAFDGPGQGGALETHGLVMTPDWHRPVGAVLDHLALDDVTLIGVSLGGCLAIRAAALEPRVARVVAFDVLSDLLECQLRQTSALRRWLVRRLLRGPAGVLIDVLVRHQMRHSLIIDWGLAQAMHIFGVDTPHAALAQSARYHTRDVSARLVQDVLLCAGAEDHYVPLHQLHEQARALTSARSLTTRVFTRAESAGNHCQVGNLPLAIGTITAWIETLRARRKV